MEEQKESLLAAQKELEEKFKELPVEQAWVDEVDEIDYTKDPFEDAPMTTTSEGSTKEDCKSTQFVNEIEGQARELSELSEFPEFPSATASTNFSHLGNWRTRTTPNTMTDRPRPQYSSSKSRQEPVETILRQITVKLTSDMEPEVVPVRLPRRA